MATPLPPPLFGATPSALPNGTIPALAAGDYLTIERDADGLVFNALVSQFDTRYTTITQGVLAAAIGDTVQAYSANLDAWAAVDVADYLTIAAGNAAYQPLNAYLSQIAGLTPGPATDGYVVAWDDGAETYALVAQSGGVTDHAELTNLAYADAGHTGFAGLAAANTFSAAQTIDGDILVRRGPIYPDDNIFFVDVANGRVRIGNVTDAAANSALNVAGKVICLEYGFYNVSVATKFSTSGNTIIMQGADAQIKTNFGSLIAVRVTSAGLVGIGTAPTAKLHVDQSSTTGAIPVLLLDQADIDQVLAKIIGTSDSGAVDRTLVKASDFPTPGAIALWIQVEIEDGRVGGIPAGDYYWPLYAAPS